jgi:hypothetical protein
VLPKRPPTRGYKALIAQAIHDGFKPGDVAARLAKGDKRLAKKYRKEIRGLLARDEEFQALLGEAARAELLAGLGTITRGLVRAGGRGRSDAVKLAYEALGFHTTKTKHEHSGSIEVKVSGVPRPTPVEEEPVPDAEVVE